MQQLIAPVVAKIGSGYPTFVVTELYKPVATTIIPARTEPFDVSAFCQSSSGFFVSRSLRKRLGLASGSMAVSVPERPYVALKLWANVYEDIRQFLPDEHLSTFEDIALLTKAQLSGQWGFLSNDGSANIAYLKGLRDKVFRVAVFWDPPDGGRSDGGWFADDWGIEKVDLLSCEDQVIVPGYASL